MPKLNSKEFRKYLSIRIFTGSPIKQRSGFNLSTISFPHNFESGIINDCSFLNISIDMTSYGI